MSEPDEAAIAELISGHRYDGVNRVPTNPGEWCNCGELVPSWSAHVAAVLAAHMADREADAADTLHRINMHTSLSSVFGKDTEPHDLYMPTWLVCRILDGEDPRPTPDTEGETDE